MKPAPLSGKQVFYDILAQRHSPLNFTLTLNLNRNRNLPTLTNQRADILRRDAPIGFGQLRQ